jgi:hypothetical protein
MARRELERRIHDLQGRLSRRAVPSGAGGPELDEKAILEAYAILYDIAPDALRDILLEAGNSEAQVQRFLDDLGDG